MAVRILRPRSSWLVYAAAACVFAVVAAAVIEVLAALLGTVPLRALLAGYPGEAQWSEPSVRYASLVIGAVGLALISLAVLPLQRRWLALWADDPRFVSGLTRSQVREELAAAAQRVAGVARATVVLDRRGATVRPAAFRPSPELAERVRAEVQQRLDELAPAYSLRICAKVDRAGGCSA